MERIDPSTPDLTARNIDRIAELFPNVITEVRQPDGTLDRGIDFDLLRQELSGDLVEGDRERYRLDWPGKRQALLAANTPINKTLRPDRAESVDFDTTKNLFIEGDNLDALKLLQESYLGKVKMIYIDPPYNTGNDFIYKDDFKTSVVEHEGRSGERDDVGNRLVTSTQANGRFHSDWLSMMYPRLKLARNLLRDDGLVFISIDETEDSNLRLMCDEVFGSENFVEQIAWKNKYGSGALTRGFANVHEYILVYSKQPIESLAAPLDDEQRAAYKLRDAAFDQRGGYVTQPLATKSKDPRPNLVYPVSWNGREVWPDRQWIWSRERLAAARERNELVFSDRDGKVTIRAKQYLKDEQGNERLGKPVSVLNGPFNQAGTKQIEQLFGERIFDFPKPVELLKYLASFVVNGVNDRAFIALDFFAGSGTLAQAIYELNADDRGTRRFIAVQLPEQTPQSSVARQRGHSTIASVSRERIRRAVNLLGASLDACAPAMDYGFRALTITSSSRLDRFHQTPSAYAQAELSLHAETLKPDRTAEDLVFQVLLDWGLDLALPLKQVELADHECWIVDDGPSGTDAALIACFEHELSLDAVEAIANLGPRRAVFRHSAFATDADRINTEQLFAKLSPHTDVKTL